MKKKVILAFCALLGACAVAFAGGQWETLPNAGDLLSGAETVPADTNAAGGAALPQTVKIPISRLGATGLQQSTPLTGFSITVAPTTNIVQITPAGTLATGTIVFPGGPANGQRIRIFSSQVITTLTLTPSAGTTITGAVTTLAANGSVEYVYSAAGTTWFRIQ